jgi:hypothetical protein
VEADVIGQFEHASWAEEDVADIQARQEEMIGGEDASNRSEGATADFRGMVEGADCDTETQDGLATFMSHPQGK